MRYICFFTLFLGLLLVFEPVQAQEKTQVTIYLKNGKVIHGAIITSIFDEYLTIEIDEVTHLDIQFSKIKNIVFRKQAKEVKAESSVVPHEPKRGFTHAADIGLLFGQNNFGNGASLSFNVINGYQFNPYFLASLGVGLDLFGRVTSMPLYASFKSTITKKKVTPYAFIHTGYAFAWGNDEAGIIGYDRVHGSWMFHPGFGYQFNMASSAILVSLGYRLQKLTLDYSTPSWEGSIFYHEERILRRLSLSVGVSF